MIPKVLKNDSKKDTEHNAKGFMHPIITPAVTSAVKASYSAFIKNATPSMELIMRARVIEGENPVIAAKLSISGSEMIIAAFLGKIKRMIANKMERCIPETAAIWERPLALSDEL